MNQKYAVIENGKVVNVIMFDPEPKANWIRSDTAAIGDTWDGQKFTRPEPKPAPPTKRETSAAEILAALLKKGVITEADLKG